MHFMSAWPEDVHALLKELGDELDVSIDRLLSDNKDKGVQAQGMWHAGLHSHVWVQESSI